MARTVSSAPSREKQPCVYVLCQQDIRTGSAPKAKVAHAGVIHLWTATHAVAAAVLLASGTGEKNTLAGSIPVCSATRRAIPRAICIPLLKFTSFSSISCVAGADTTQKAGAMTLTPVGTRHVDAHARHEIRTIRTVPFYVASTCAVSLAGAMACAVAGAGLRCRPLIAGDSLPAHITRTRRISVHHADA